MGLDVEILYVALALRYRVAEVPVTWTEVPGSKVDLVRDSLHGAGHRVRSFGLFGGCGGCRASFTASVSIPVPRRWRGIHGMAKAQGTSRAAASASAPSPQ